MFDRYAIYYAPQPGAFADRAAAWLGWDAARGADCPPHPLSALTDEPRKYGFHGTIKPPFRLATGHDAQGLRAAVAELAGRLAPVTLPGLRLARLGHFLALIPEGDTTALSDLAARVVMALDPFRAPPTEAEIARRKPDSLSPRQRDLLAQWGYPYVLEEFRFHLTLTGPVTPDQADEVEASLAPLLDARPQPFMLQDLCLFGQAKDGRFHLLERFALTASAST